VLETCPDIFVIGNQPALQTRLLHRQDGSPIRILLLSKFSQEPAIHLVSLRDLSAKVIKINIPN
jgi:DNA polymerase delta subunit 2